MRMTIPISSVLRFVVLLILIALPSCESPMKADDSVVYTRQNWKVDVGVEPSICDLEGTRPRNRMGTS